VLRKPISRFSKILSKGQCQASFETMMTDQCDRPLASHHLRPQGQNDHDDNSNVIKGSHDIAASQCGRLAAGYSIIEGRPEAASCHRERPPILASTHRQDDRGPACRGRFAGQVIRDQRRFPLGDDSFL
jgi:hypothetical protein